MALARLFLALYSILLAAAAAGLAVLAWNQDQKLDLTAGDDFNLQAFIVSDDTSKWILTVLAGLICLLAVLTLVLAFRRAPAMGGGRRSRGMLRLQQAGGGTVEVTSEAVEELIGQELMRLPSVRQAGVNVRVAGSSVDSLVTLAVEPGTNIAEVTNDAAQAVAMTMRDQIGVTNVKRPTVRVQHTAIEGMRTQNVPPAAPVMSQSPPPAPPPPPPPPAGPPPQAQEQHEGLATTWSPPPRPDEDVIDDTGDDGEGRTDG